MIKNYSIFFLLGLLLVACERMLPFPEDTPNPVLVTRSFITSDSLWKVALYQSESIDSIIYFTEVTNGNVEILHTASNSKIKLNHQENGIYTASEWLPQLENNYRLLVAANGFPSISAESTIPANLDIQLLSYQPNDYQNLPNYLFDFVINDATTTANFYLFEIFYQLEQENYTLTEKAGHFSFDPNSENETVIIDHFNLQRSYLTDAHFNGQPYVTQIGATSSLLEKVVPSDRLSATIRIKSITEAGYLYLKSVERFENFEEEIFTDPISVYSNIEGGLGVFAGYSEKIILVELQ